MEPHRKVIGTSYLDAVEAELQKVSPGLRGRVWERTGGNMLDASKGDPASWILQVPDCWGWSTGQKPFPEGADKPGIKKFLAKVQANISEAENSVDITAFGAPNIWGCPADAFPDGHFAVAIGAGLKAAAARAAASAGRRLKVRVLTGVTGFSITPSSPWAFRDLLREMVGDDVRAVDFCIASMTTRGLTSYNHTKFLVVDGRSVIHGGINWMNNFYVEDGLRVPRVGGFGGVSPVTDLDIALRGPAAASAVRFLDELWTWTCENASTTRKPDAGAWLATNNDRVEEGIPRLYKAFEPPYPGNLQVISVGSLGYGIQQNDPASTYQPPPADHMDQAACRWSGKVNNETNTDRDFMTVNPDANAMQALIACAQRKIVLSQQDINGYSGPPLRHALFDVRLLDAIAAKMTADRPVKVRIVLSNPGTPDFSNINDLGQAVNALFDRVKLKTASDDDAFLTMNENLQLAPLRVAGQPTWPNGRKYRLHTKVICVDDTAFYVGSRNAYPDTTQDHGFIIEDAAAAQQLNTEFLDKEWHYSKEAAIYDWERNIHPPKHPPYKAAL